METNMSIAELKRENAELKSANRELQNQLSLMRTIFDRISEGVVATNLEGEFLLANPTAMGIVGMGPTEEAPEEWAPHYGTFYPDRVTPVPSPELPLYKAMQGEITNNVELFIRNAERPDGVFISVSGRPLLDETGSLIGGVAVLRDVSELREVQEQLEATITDLQDQTELMDAIFNSISDGVIVADKQGKYVLFNETAKQMAGHSLDNVYIKHASQKFGLFEPDGKSPFPVEKLPLARAIRGEPIDRVEILIRNPQLPQGIYASISGRPLYNEAGDVTGGVAVICDISTLKETEAQLQALNNQLADQSELLHSIFNSISDGVLVADETGSITISNPSVERIVGVAISSEVLEDWCDLHECFYPDGITPFPPEEQPLVQALHGISTDDVEIFVKNSEVPDGVYINVNGRPLQSGDGSYKGGVIVFHDVTGRVRDAEALNQAFTQGRLEVVDTILHDIGNAINSVAVGIDTIREQLARDRLVNRLAALAHAIEQHQDDLISYIKNDPQGKNVVPFLLMLSSDFANTYQGFKETVERVRDRTRHIVDIIRTQRMYRSTGRGRKVINLAVAISDAIKILQNSIDRRQIQIEIDCDNAPQEILIQESPFHQMLVNLIKNSIEAIDDLTTSGKASELPRIQIRAYIDDDFLCIAITDNGIGIAPQNIKKIFAVGFTTKKHGNGLGLHSSANFMTSSGGKIQPFSEGIGKGATMCIMLRRSSIQLDNYQDLEWVGETDGQF